MEWKRRSPQTSTIQDVIERNTNLSIEELDKINTTPYLHGLSDCCEVVKECIQKGVPIKIIGDYDCDGVCSTEILYLGIKEITNKAPTVIIPKRFSEGYGLNMSIINQIDEGLIITVDNGITAVEQITKAKEKGLKVVIIDHHIRRDDGLLPPADAILDPCAVEGSEYTDYCGAGLAYRFIKELNPDTLLDEKLVALAGIATVADVMKLLGANRDLVKRSLKAVKDGNVTFGLWYLMQASGLSSYPVAHDYGFVLGPCINASGRLYDDGAKMVFELLAKDAEIGSVELFEIDSFCKSRAEQIVEINNNRKKIVRNCMKNLTDLEYAKPIIYYNEDISEGIVGIIAGKLSEKFNVPALVFTNSEKEGILKGSGRSIPEVHLKKLLDTASDLFEGYGGHAGAAGMSIKAENLNILRQRLTHVLKDVEFKAPDVIEYDIEINEGDVPTLADELSLYEPFGEANPKVRVLLKNFIATPSGSSHYVAMGDEGNHVKVFGKDVSLLMFDMAERYEADGFPSELDVIGELSINHFNGKVSYQLEVIDYKKAQKKKTATYTKMANLFTFV